nr:putative disease resistance protein RGA4 [Quercus suber]
MAEGALFDLAGKVLELLGSLIVQEVKLASSVKTEMENLRNTVSTIHAVILDAEKKSSHSNQIKDWLSKLKDVLLDADDLLDDFSTEVMRRKVMTKKVRIFCSISNPLAFSPNMGREIKAIREKLNAIAKDKENFHFSQSFIEPQVMNRSRETYSFVLEDEVIGRENDKKEIMERLFDDNVVANISIIPIVGIGGLGKTTLAQLVYNDENVKRNFEPKLWICISDIFDVKQIFKEILEQLTERKHEESLEILQNKLREKLNGKKYLIVLDDLWNEDNSEWLLLRNLLMVGARGSRILVITRLESVARIIGATSWHTLRSLPEEKAWNLFVKVAFEQVQEQKNKALVAIGRKIVEKCYGLPLAIRTIGSLLYLKTSETEWQSFLDDELSKIGQRENKISSTLKLSYDHLPPHLKQCFAYCRLFPKDYRINVVTLTNLWVAQGFIVLEDPRQSFVDIGRKYFMELLWRSFFQDVENDKWGNIAWCKMHDLMHDLASLVSRTESAILNSSGENVIEKVRHVSFNLVDTSMQFSISMPNGKKIRTVLAFNIGGNLGNLTCDALISNFKCLRTLNLSYLGLHVMPRSIGKLKHLRYLDLSGNDEIKILPNSITKMLNLQTLILRGCRLLRELPKGIKKLVNLRFLDITECNQLIDNVGFQGIPLLNQLTSKPLEIRHHTYLETILPGCYVRMEGSRGQSYFGSYKKKRARSNGPSQLKELRNLGGNLRIVNLGHGKDEVDANLKEKRHLQQLLLEWDASEWDGETDELLEGLQPHPNLKALELQYYMGVRIPSWVFSKRKSSNFLMHSCTLRVLYFLVFVLKQRVHKTSNICVNNTVYPSTREWV